MSSWDWPGSKVTRVIDGDTIVAELHRDLGFNGVATFQQRLRLSRINAPAISLARGKEARARVEALTLLAPTVVHIVTVGAYKYGDEWMAEVTLPDNRNLADLLVQEGLAVYWGGNGPRPGEVG